jgi:transposase
MAARYAVEAGQSRTGSAQIGTAFVKPYVKTNENDRNDAEAICEALSRPNMRYVPVKTAERQALP